MSKKIAILGAGISGLSIAWYLKKKYGLALDLTLYEAKEQVGGWIDTKQGVQKDDFLFELGPHSLRCKTDTPELLELIEELNLSSSIIYADPEAKNRYLYFKNQLVKTPNSFFELFSSPLTKDCFWRLAKDLISPRSFRKDESVYDFFSRRISSTLTKRFIDPLVKGIYAAKPESLSMVTCFPELFKKEQKDRSLFLSFLKNYFSKASSSSTIFTLDKGLNRLPKAMAAQLQAKIKYQKEILSIIFQKKGIVIKDKQQEENFDAVISTISAPKLAPLLAWQELKTLLKKIPHFSLVVSHLGYKQILKKPKGFGYLVPSYEKQNILGVIFDSDIFPNQNKHFSETRLTVLLGGEGKENLVQQPKNELSLLVKKTLADHLAIKREPDFQSCFFLKEALPHYFVGYLELKKKIDETIAQQPFFKLFGISFNGVAVPQLITEAKKFVDQYNLDFL